MQEKKLYHNEFDLLAGFISGDEHAFKVMYDLHYHAMWSFAAQVIHDEEQARDFVSESFIKTWEKRTEFKSLAAVKNFLFIVLRNSCFNHYKKMQSRRKSAREIAFLQDDMDNSFITRQVRAELLNHAVIESGKLPPQMKKIFQLIYIEGLSQQEVAYTLGLSVLTVRSQKFKAITKLKTALEKKGLLGMLFL